MSSKKKCSQSCPTELFIGLGQIVNCVEERNLIEKRDRTWPQNSLVMPTRAFERGHSDATRNALILTINEWPKCSLGIPSSILPIVIVKEFQDLLTLRNITSRLFVLPGRKICCLQVVLERDELSDEGIHVPLLVQEFIGEIFRCTRTYQLFCDYMILILFQWRGTFSKPLHDIYSTKGNSMSQRCVPVMVWDKKVHANNFT